MAKLSVSIDVPLPPQQAWADASNLSRYKEWLTIHRVWRSTLPEQLEKGTVIESILEVKGIRDESDKAKAQTTRELWVPGVNALGGFGRWGFEEFRDWD